MNKKTRLKKDRIAILCVIIIVIVGFSFRGCFQRCTSPNTESKDTIPTIHLNDSLSNALTEGPAYHEMDSLIERYLKRWEINGAQLVITRNDSLLCPWIWFCRQRERHQDGTQHGDAFCLGI